MSFDPVPWFVGGGAQHSPEVARLLAYAAFGGREGIVGRGDLKVSAQAVPGASVRVAPGACAILNRASGGQYQAYAGRVVSEVAVPIAATDSSGGRSDLIVARVEDPFMPGEPWDDPADPTVGPYIFVRVIPGVPAGTTTVEELGLGYSAIPLARIDIPASTATITNAMITDLRSLVNPRRQRRLLVTSPSGNQDVTGATFVDWPSSAVQSVQIPEWATQARVVTHVGGAVVNVDRADGYIRNRIGSLVGQSTRFDTNSAIGAGGSEDKTLMTADTFSVGSSLRGTVQQVALQACVTNRGSSGNGYLRAYEATTVVMDIEFYEVPE